MNGNKIAHDDDITVEPQHLETSIYVDKTTSLLYFITYIPSLRQATTVNMEAREVFILVEPTLRIVCCRTHRRACSC